MKAVIFIIFALLASGADYWVSPSGSDVNPGTYAQPWALTKIAPTTRAALPISAVSAGDTVWMRGGTYLYNQELFADLVGTADNYITIRAVPGETPVITASQMGFAAQLQIGGSYVQFVGITVAYVGPRVETAGGRSTVVQIPVGLNVSSQLLGNPTGVRLINCWSYGNRGTISATSSDYRTIYYGGINFDQGSDGPNRLHGGWMYQQNNIANGQEIAKHNVSLLQPYWYNFRIYTQGGWTSGISHDGEIIIGGDNFISTPLINASVYRSFIVSRRFSFGSGSDYVIQQLLLADNHMMLEDGLTAGINGDASGLTISGNAIADSISDVGYLYPAIMSITSWPVFANNTIHKARGSFIRCLSELQTVPGEWTRYGPTSLAWENWLALGHDIGSTCQIGPPPENWVKLYANEYEQGRAHIGIYNWTGAAAQSVDVSSILNVGDHWELIDLWTPLSAPVATGTYAGGSISVPLTGTDYYTPWGANGNASRPRACWEVDRANCLTSGDYVVAASVGELPAGTALYQPALLSSNYAVYYWTGSAWASADVTMATHAGPTYQREPNAHAFLLRRVYDGRDWTTLAWRGAATDAIQAGVRKLDGTYDWGSLPVSPAACTDGRCTARVPQPVGDAYWRINGGAALKMAAR